MNNGAFGENFPYSNFHDLNMDWIIQVVKDFLDKYTTLIETIDNGKTEIINITEEELQALSDKAEELENLLQQWYDTHSSEIAEELATAISSFDYHANTKTAESIASIPDDYTELSHSVLRLKTVLAYPSSPVNFAENLTPIKTWLDTVGGTYTENDGVITITSTGNILTPFRFSNNDIPVLLHADIHYLSGTNFRMEILDNNNNVTGIISNQLASIWCRGSQIRMNYGSAGQTEVSNVFTMQIDTDIHKDYGTFVHPSNYTTTLPDANNAHPNMTYRFGGFADNDTNIPANLPFTTWKTLDKPAMLIDFASSTSNIYRIQLFISLGTGEIYQRYYNHTYNLWNPWKLLIDSPQTIIVAPSGGDYTSITRAIENCKNLKNATIIIKAGNYNIISEINDFYGENYLDNLTEAWYGNNILQNGITLKFSPGAIVTCDYTGTNQYARNYFSPFNGGSGGFTIEGIHISCSGVRYCIHDERGTFQSTPEPYANTYKNCYMYKDSGNGTLQPQCIGGGLGVHGTILIEDCIFSGDLVTEQTYVSYHNSSHSQAESFITVKNCYFDKKGKIRFAHYGTSVHKTNCLVSDNRFGAPIEIAYESPSYNTPNMQVLAWNNLIN